jgi:hypothetical protein
VVKIIETENKILAAKTRGEEELVFVSIEFQFYKVKTILKSIAQFTVFISTELDN